MHWNLIRWLRPQRKFLSLAEGKRFLILIERFISILIIEAHPQTNPTQEDWSKSPSQP